jgi:hypothetical protein
MVSLIAIRFSDCFSFSLPFWWGCPFLGAVGWCWGPSSSEGPQKHD